MILRARRAGLVSAISAATGAFLFAATAGCVRAGGPGTAAPKHGTMENDWCGEHGVPESQCRICNPEIALPAAQASADVKTIAHAGEDVPALEAHLVPGKVTVFDFYADWCGPCRQIDAHMLAVANGLPHVAYRKLNVLAWDSALAKRYLGRVAGLPYVVVYGRDGSRVREIVGLNLLALDAAIQEGANVKGGGR